MDLPDKEFFDKLMKLTEENNRLLRRIRRTSRIVAISRIFYWIILIGVSIGAYYYIQPYLDHFLQVYKDTQNATAKFQGFVNPFTQGSQ